MLLCQYAQAQTNSSIYRATVSTVNQLGWQRYSQTYGTLSFNYPTGWEVGKQDNVRAAFTENRFVQPVGQDFNGQSGQVVIRIFEPVSIMEDTKSLSCSYSLDLFSRFVRQISEGSMPSVRTVSNNGRTYFMCSQVNDGFETRIIGSRSVNGNLFVLAMAAAPYVTTTNETILFRMAESIRGAEPAAYLTDQEAVVKNWYSALARRDYTELDRLSCSSIQQTNILIDLFAPRARQGAINASSSYDFSNLRYYTVAGNNNLVAVRICGNIIGPDGQVKSQYNYAKTLGGSNLYVVKVENGSWKFCQPVGR